MVIDTREIDNGARLDIGNLVGLARVDLSGHGGLRARTKKPGGSVGKRKKGRERRNEIRPSLYRARAGVEKIVRHF